MVARCTRKIKNYCTLWVPALYNITPEQYVELVLTDWARTVAGVHYRQDNLAGLNIGQRIIRERLPEHLKIHYGIGEAELGVVRHRLEAFSFDWNTFDPKRLTIDGMSVTDFFEAAKERDHCGSLPEITETEEISGYTRRMLKTTSVLR